VEQALRDLPVALPSIGPLLDPVELREDWPGLDPGLKRAAVAAAVSGVKVLKATKTGGRFDGDTRLAIAWREYPSAPEVIEDAPAA
jgi:hypothetical protein